MVESVLLQIRARVRLDGLATTAKKVGIELIDGLPMRITSGYTVTANAGGAPLNSNMKPDTTQFFAHENAIFKNVFS